MRYLKKAYNLLFYVIMMQLILGLTALFPNLKLFNKIRGFMVKPFFKKCGKNFQLAKGSIINMSRNIEIGDNVYIAHNVWINGVGGLNISDDVVISPNVVIATAKHSYINNKISNSKAEYGQITIDCGSWIASNCTITMNTKIGKGCIVGACSSVTKDIPDYCFAGGVPAKIIKEFK